MTPRARGNAIRIVVAAAVLIGVVWFLKFRGGSAKAPGPDAAALRGSSSGAPRGGGAAGRASDRVVPVQVALVERTDLPVWLEGLGTVAAFQQVTVRPQVDGRLDKVLFAEGKVVTAGEVIAEIDPRPFLVQLHQAQGALARDKAQADASRKNYERYKGLADQQLVARQQVEEIAGQLGQYEGSIQIDRAQVEAAQLQLDYAKVKAPITGITGVRLVAAGNLVKANDPVGIVVITAIDPAAVLFTIPQDRLSAVAAASAKGDVAVEVWNRDGSQKLATGALSVLDNQINQATSTLRLKALVPNPTRTLWPNAFVKVKMLVETLSQALVVPAVAVQRGPQGTFVYIVGADGTAQMKPVTVGLITAGRAVIEKGLDGGEQVVTEGQNQLRPGGKVEAVKPARGSAAEPTASNIPAPK
ncbi:MdtA/MuxA family multidrug efflux RND transporter periplasmic adaptor subunit [soil metagenome]